MQDKQTPEVGEKFTEEDDFLLSIRADLVSHGLKGSIEFSKVIVPTTATLVTLYIALAKYVLIGVTGRFHQGVFLIPPILLSASLILGMWVLQPIVTIASLGVPDDIADVYNSTVKHKHQKSLFSGVFLALGISSMFVILLLAFL